MSNEEWNFKDKHDMIYIENISRKKVLGITNDSEVILEDFKLKKTKLSSFGKKELSVMMGLMASIVLKILKCQRLLLLFLHRT